MSKTFLVVPQGQDGQLPPGQLPPQVEPPVVALKSSGTGGRVPAMVMAKKEAMRATRRKFILFNGGIELLAASCVRIPQQNRRKIT